MSQQYPKYKYHAKHPARVVKSSIEEQQLGQGWIDTPVQAPNEEVGQAPLGHYISPEEQKERDNAHARVLLENQKLREELAKRDAQAPQAAQPMGELEEVKSEQEEESDGDDGEEFDESEEGFNSSSDESDQGDSESEEEETEEEPAPELTKAQKKAADKKAKKRSGR